MLCEILLARKGSHFCYAKNVKTRKLNSEANCKSHAALAYEFSLARQRTGIFCKQKNVKTRGLSFRINQLQRRRMQRYKSQAALAYEFFFAHQRVRIFSLREKNRKTRISNIRMNQLLLVASLRLLYEFLLAREGSHFLLSQKNVKARMLT